MVGGSAGLVAHRGARFQFLFVPVRLFPAIQEGARIAASPFATKRPFGGLEVRNSGAPLHLL
jgi:hypothetical protein